MTATPILQEIRWVTSTTGRYMHGVSPDARSWADLVDRRDAYFRERKLEGPLQYQALCGVSVRGDPDRASTLRCPRCVRIIERMEATR